MYLELIKFINLNYSGSIVLETFIIFLRKFQMPQDILTQHSDGGEKKCLWLRFISNSMFLRVFSSSTLSLKHFKLYFGHTIWLAGSQFPNQGLNVCPQHWKHGVLTTGPPGNSLKPISIWGLYQHSMMSVIIHKSIQTNPCPFNCLKDSHEVMFPMFIACPVKLAICPDLCLVWSNR